MENKPKIALNSGGIVILNKPIGFTSNRYLSFFKRCFGIRKCGYAGTLDPLACGVLPVGFGKCTKLLSKLTDLKKRYTFTVRFGIDTDSGDCDGSIVNVSNKIPSLLEIQNVLPSFIGRIRQSPPVFSAVKHKGLRLCDIARKKNISFEELSLISKEKEKEINIFDLQVRQSSFIRSTDCFDFTVLCSKGTYVRQLAKDIGKSLCTYGTIKFLRRDSVGNMDLQKSLRIDKKLTLDELKANLISTAELSSLCDDS